MLCGERSTFNTPMIEIQIASSLGGKFDKIYKNCNIHIETDSLDKVQTQRYMSTKVIKPSKITHCKSFTCIKGILGLNMSKAWEGP